MHQVLSYPVLYQEVQHLASIPAAASPLSAQQAAAFRGSLPQTAPDMYIGELPPQLPHDEGKLTVVLDVDETLIHTELIPIETMQGVVDTPEVFHIVVQGMALRVRKRPFLDGFLREASKKFELIAFTAGAEEYAGPVLNRLDPTGTIFRHRLFRQHCYHHEGTNFVKDLRIINRPLNRSVLVDNNAYSFFLQLENGIPIASFFDDITDKALITLYRFLESIENMYDVRFALDKVFNLGAAFGGVARLRFQTSQ